MSNSEQMSPFNDDRVTATLRRSTLEESHRRNSRTIQIDGLFEYDVLGTFKVIRGFADLRDLADISRPIYLDEGGIQRREDETRTTEIKNYLETQSNRFFPEVILSLRASSHEIPESESQGANEVGSVDVTPLGVEIKTDDGISLRPLRTVKRAPKTGREPHSLLHRVTIQRRHLAAVRKRIRRIDGNHRLSSAEKLTDTDFSSRKYLAPFCLLLLDDVGQQSDDYAEALIFHAINSKAVPVHSEHALRLVLDQPEDIRMRAQEEFEFDPALYLTRLLQNWLQNQSPHFQEMVGEASRSAFNRTANYLVHEPKLKNLLDTREKLEAFATEFCGVLNQALVRLQPMQKKLCKTPYFWEVVARVWLSHSERGIETQVEETVSELQAFGTWTEKLHLLELAEGFTLGEGLLHLFHEAQKSKPQRVFLARWYPSDGDTAQQRNSADDRLAALKTVVEAEFQMQLIDMGTQAGSSFPIHAEMYRAIQSADIFIADLTGKRPNVMIELGFGLRHIEQSRLIMLFQPENASDKPPFDVNTFRYEVVNGIENIKEGLRKHLRAILSSSTYEGDPTHAAWRSWLNSNGSSVLRPEDHLLLVKALESATNANVEQEALLARLKACLNMPWASDMSEVFVLPKAHL